MNFQKVDQPGFLRDIESRAVSITDDSAREEHRHRIRTKRELDELRSKVIELEECCQNSKIELENIKTQCFLLDQVRMDLQQLKEHIQGNK